jgi:ribonuclease Z
MSERELIILGSSSQQPTRTRNHGAYLMVWNGEGLLFDPGEGTQRQFIYADVAPPTVTRIFITHFHGDHCLGLGSMIMRLNLDRVPHAIHCYYPASGKKYFDRLRYGTICHDAVKVIEHPIETGGLVHDDGKFRIEAEFMEHGVDNVSYRVTEPDKVKFYQEKLDALGLRGESMRSLIKNGEVLVGDQLVKLEDVSWIRKGDSLAVIMDTRKIPACIKIAQGAKLLLCESTYLEKHKDLAYKHFHLTCKQAAEIAREAGVEHLVLTHFSARYYDMQEFIVEARQIFKNTDVAEDFKRFTMPR